MLSGFCLPAMFYIRNPVRCSQPLINPMACHSHFGFNRGIKIMGRLANRYCHNYNGLMVSQVRKIRRRNFEILFQGRCLPYHCENHLDCGFVLVNDYAYLGSCIAQRCSFDISPALSKIHVMHPRPKSFSI